MKAVNSDLFFSNITIKLFQFILLFLVFISGPLSAKAQQSTEYISPDGHLKAVVESYNKKDNGYQGIKFEIQKINGEIIAQHQRNLIEEK